jgi:diguanylate cyclase (GGDEF)-like protein
LKDDWPFGYLPPCVEGSHGGQIARSPKEQEQLAKEWLLRLIERTPLPEVGDLPVSWITSEAPALIADIIAALTDPSVATERELEPAERQRAAMLRSLREGPGASEQIPRDLAVLQALLVETIRREIPERSPGDFARAVERLAEVFGTIQGAVTRSLVEERGGAAASDPLTGLPGPPQLEEWMRILLANQKRYDHGFALALVDIDGLARVNDAYGRSAGNRMVTAVAGVISRQVRATDQAFRLEQDEFAILAPHQEAAGMVPMAERIAGLVEGSQAAEGPQIAIAAGVVGCPADGDTVERLLESATEATYAAKASGQPVAMGPNSSAAPVQDS